MCQHPGLPRGLDDLLSPHNRRKILAIIPPISAFVAAGFEHSVANMYFIPSAYSLKLLILSLLPKPVILQILPGRISL
jgi:formate/nitrite transporter FocA (FNT family)